MYPTYEFISRYLQMTGDKLFIFADLVYEFFESCSVQEKVSGMVSKTSHSIIILTSNFWLSRTTMKKIGVFPVKVGDVMDVFIGLGIADEIDDFR